MVVSCNYDELNQLISENGTSYQYDDAGNLSSDIYDYLT
ncbi:hypothetical protein [uncultured Ruminococcus sp.]